jgi:hypothetical protein
MGMASKGRIKTRQRRRHGQIRKNGKQEREKRVAKKEERNTAFRQSGKRRESYKPETSDRDWSFRSPQERREGTAAQIKMKKRFPAP